MACTSASIASLFPWLLARSSAHFTRTDWERLIEEQLCPAIIPHLPGCRPPHELLLRVLAEGIAAGWNRGR